MHKKKNVVILAPKHVGKTTTAKELSYLSEIPFFDSDALIIDFLFRKHQKQYRTVAEFFSQEGKDSFLQVESTVTREFLTQHDEFILATGGGVADNSAALLHMEKSYKVFLVAEAERICQRVFHFAVPVFVQVGVHKECGDSLSDLSQDELLQKHQEYFVRIFRQRNKIYKSLADFTLSVGSKTPQQIAKRIYDTM